MNKMFAKFIPETVYNEVELCEVADPQCKVLIEKGLLNKRISYYIRWPKISIFNRRKHLCIICVNDNAKEEAENIVRTICDESGYQVRFLLRRSHNVYL